MLPAQILVVAIFLSSLLQAGETLQINTTGRAPLNTPGSSGFMDEVAREALARIGYKLKTLKLPAERALLNANRGLIDGEMSRIKGLSRSYSNLVRVPEKIMDWEFVAFSHGEQNFERGWQTLSGRSVAYINGWKIIEKSIPSNSEVTRTANASQLFGLLKKDRSEFVLYERWGGVYYIKKNGLDNIKMNRPPLVVKEMFIYLHKKHGEIVPRLAAALKEMKNDGSYQAYVMKHLSVLDEKY